MDGLKKALYENNAILTEAKNEYAIEGKYHMYIDSLLEKLSDKNNRFNSSLEAYEIE